MDPLCKKTDGGGSATPAICVPIAGATIDEIRDEAEAAAAEGPNLLEWRADYYPEISDADRASEALLALRASAGALPILFTCRRKAEGGTAALSAGEYSAVLDWAIPRPEIDLVDIEALQPDFDPREHIAEAFREGKTTIASAHIFDRMPGEEELWKLLFRLEETGAEILKLAVMAEKEDDAFTLMRVTDAYRRKSCCRLVTIAMGEAGVISRTTGALTGSVITFGTVKKKTAPGQLSVRELKELL